MSTPIWEEGRRLLAEIDPDLLPLGVDQDSASHPDEWFVCDASGLAFATPREADQDTAELIAYAINLLHRLLNTTAERDDTSIAAAVRAEAESWAALKGGRS